MPKFWGQITVMAANVLSAVAKTKKIKNTNERIKIRKNVSLKLSKVVYLLLRNTFTARTLYTNGFVKLRKTAAASLLLLFRSESVGGSPNSSWSENGLNSSVLAVGGG